ncbi:MAG: mandelate racemase/muconate lactonizing enzyme family protein [Candidatus Thermoplasmatota archaeon]|nr:mandelate racemase/muconate lactonizing enzyme family protein [Candidatus Thermoplasmatota archaeon]
MLIKHLKTHVLSAVWRNFVIVEITTDEGIKGYGEATLGDFEQTAVAAVKDLEPFVVGKEIEINEMTNFFQHNFFWRNGPVLTTAESAIEQAMWDAFGKTLNSPVHRLIGGSVRRKVRVYANGFVSGDLKPEEFSSRAAQIVERGFNAMKFDPFGGAGPTITTAQLENAYNRIKAIRERVGEDVDLLIEAHGRFNPRTALKIASRIEDLNPLWLEEPVPESDIESMAEVHRSSNVPIATGERILYLERFRDLFNARAADIIQPDVCHMGGILPLTRVGAMASTYNVMVAPHNPSGPVSTAASLQALCTLPNGLILEFWLDAETVRESMVRNYFTIKNGYLDVPKEPGLGIDIVEESLDSFPYKKLHLEYYSDSYYYHGDIK